MVIAVSALGTTVQGFSFPLTSPPTTTTTTTTITLTSPFTSSDDAAIDVIPTGSSGGVGEVRARLSKVLEELKGLRDEVALPSVREAIDEVIKSLKDIDSLLESLETVSPIPNEARAVINKTLSDLKELLDELRGDIEALKEAKIALAKIEAVAGVLADKAFEEAKSGNIGEAEKLAQKALNITNGVIDAYYRKAQVFETYATAFKNICEALTELVKALYLYG